ncbi:MAG: ATP-binding protein [Verrucomicrobia bacterium]|nr:ATP-binding protein [Verrucomicrobiota bacterium]
MRLLPHSRKAALAIALPLILCVAALDYITGRDLVTSPFYLLPICWVGWLVGRRSGLVLAVISAAVWLTEDLLHGYAYPQGAIPYWNAFMLLVFFLLVVYLLTAFHDAHAHLEDTVAQRTAALNTEIVERKRLEAGKIQAERMATVGMMAAEVAHEVRSPLGALALNLDLIQKEIESLAKTSSHPQDEGGILVREMRGEVQRIQHVLEDYLQFARLPKPRFSPVDLQEMLENKLAFMRGTIEQAGITLRTNFDPSLKNVNADPEQLWQAALNLIRNGIEAMPEGGELIVSTWREGGEARMRVADTGAGMTAEQVEQVCVPFFSSKPTGTGLGLALVQQIIIAHGGRVECESAPGKGCTFTLFLPLAENS